MNPLGPTGRLRSGRQDRKCGERMSSGDDRDREIERDDPLGPPSSETDEPDEEQGETSGVETLRSDLSERARRQPTEPDQQKRKIPQGRISRSAKLGTAIGGQATRYAGTMAANVARSSDKSAERLETRHLETALKMASVLGEMKGAAMKIGQMASFIDTDFLPPEYREIYQKQLAKLRTHAPAMPWEKVQLILDEEYDERPERVFASIDEEAFAAASIGQVHKGKLRDGTEVAIKVQYPGIADALESDVANAGILVRLARALAPGLDAKAVAAELKERVLEELDYEYEAQNQRAFARAYDGHPFIHVPKVHSRHSRRRVLVSDYVEGRGFEEVKDDLEQDERDIFGEIVFRFCFGSIYHLQHFNADTHPGNYLLMDDGRVAFLDFGMTKKLTSEQIQLEQRAVDAAARDDPEALRDALHVLGFVNDPNKVDAERLMEHVKMVGGWYLQDGDVQITPKRVMKMIEVTSDPRSDFYDLVRRESLPADELMGRRMETGLLAVLAQLKARANWHRIMREWVYAEPPSTVLGEAEWRYFERRGTLQTPGLATRT
jgi:predicted unusual protein kinase regulating ubiquinone biosynthesis (AarF/ABC1/UbiB family)